MEWEAALDVLSVLESELFWGGGEASWLDAGCYSQFPGWPPALRAIMNLRFVWLTCGPGSFGWAWPWLLIEMWRG